MKLDWKSNKAVLVLFLVGPNFVWLMVLVLRFTTDISSNTDI